MGPPASPKGKMNLLGIGRGGRRKASVDIAFQATPLFSAQACGTQPYKGQGTSSNVIRYLDVAWYTRIASLHSSSMSVHRDKSHNLIGNKTGDKPNRHQTLGFHIALKDVSL